MLNLYLCVTTLEFSGKVLGRRTEYCTWLRNEILDYVFDALYKKTKFSPKKTFNQRITSSKRFSKVLKLHTSTLVEIFTMKLTILPSLLLSLSTFASASHVGYFTSTGSSPQYKVQVAITLAIPAAYTLITNAPANIDSLSRLALSDLYDLSADVWMFPPQAEYFQYASNAASHYVTVGAGLVFEGADLANIREICETVAAAMGITNRGSLGAISKRDMDDELEMALLLPRDGSCPAYKNFVHYVTGDSIQSMNTQGSCANL
jgi:hypothetical protein